MTILAYCGDDLLPNVRKAVTGAGGYILPKELNAALPDGSVSVAIIEYPEHSGGEFTALTRRLTGRRIPFVVLCRRAEDGFKAYGAGAVGMIVIPRQSAAAPGFFAKQLSGMITNIHKNGDLRVLKRPELYAPVRKVIAIGASTGGSEAVELIIRALPADAPPVVVVLHMPPVFTRLYAERLNSVVSMSVWEACEGDRLRSGLVLVAPGEKHLEIKKEREGFCTTLSGAPPIANFRPSVDLFFNSVARCVRDAAIGVILTGMGADGAKGLRAMRMVGAHTIGQDESTSVVYGMPRVAYEMDAVAVQAPIHRIAGLIMERI